MHLPPARYSGLWLAILLVSSMSACTSTRVLEAGSYQAAGEGPKIPLKVALVVDQRKSLPHVVASGDAQSFVGFDIDVGPFLGQAMAAELGAMFKDVKVVADAKQVRDADLLATVSFQSQKKQYRMFDCQIDLALVEPKTKRQIGKYSQSETIDINFGSGEATYAVLTGLSLFLLSPITMPLAASSAAEHASGILEQRLPEMVRGVGNYVKFDQAVAAYRTGPEGGVATTSPSAIGPLVVVSDVDRIAEGKPPSRKNAYAIVIGIERYRQKLPQADFAIHDARIMAEYLTKALGVPEENLVTLLGDHATKTDLEKYLDGWLPNRVERDDSVFIYYAGHGAPNPKTGEAYIVPYDGDPTYIETTGYSMKRLHETLAKLQSKEVIVMLDSGFSGAGGRSVLGKGMRPVGFSIEGPRLAAGKTTVLASAFGDQVSGTYEAKGHGLLTYFFLKGLQGEGDLDKDGKIELGELFDYLKPQVERTARREFNNEQTPQLVGNREAINKPLLGK